MVRKRRNSGSCVIWRQMDIRPNSLRELVNLQESRHISKVCTEEHFGRILGKANIKTTFKPIKTLGHIFIKPKDKPRKWQTKCIVYKVKGKSCPFTYIGKLKISWSSRESEHCKPGTRRENFSAIKQHVETTTHDNHPNYAEIKEKDVNNLRQR